MLDNDDAIKPSSSEYRELFLSPFAQTKYKIFRFVTDFRKLNSF